MANPAFGGEENERTFVDGLIDYELLCQMLLMSYEHFRNVTSTSLWTLLLDLCIQMR